MANFNGLILTQAGANLQDKIAVSGATLQFTRAAIGDGLWPAGLDPTSLTGLVSEKKSLAIQGLTDEGTGQHKISVLVDNTGLAVGFMTREIGVFADDPDLGEVLYQVTSADSPDYLPPDGGATHIEMALDLVVVTSSASSVTAVINEGLVYARKEDVTAARDSFKGFDLDGEHAIYEGDLDAVARNSLYAIQQGVATPLPEDMAAGAWGYVHTMVLPGDAGRTQVLWSQGDPDRPGWWRRRAAGAWGNWDRLVVGSEFDALATLAAQIGAPIGALLYNVIPGHEPPLYAPTSGQVTLRADYPELWALVEGGAIADGTWLAQAGAQSSVGFFSSGDGESTFRWPLLVDFVRAADPAGGRPVGTWQADAFKAHAHTGGTNLTNAGDGGGGTRGTSLSILTGTTGGPETRPKSISYPAWIKYA